MPFEPLPQDYLNGIVSAGIETLAKNLHMHTRGSGYEYIVMVLPYHLTQVKHLSTEQRTLLEKKVAIAAQRELHELLKEEGKGMI